MWKSGGGESDTRIKKRADPKNGGLRTQERDDNKAGCEIACIFCKGLKVRLDKLVPIYFFFTSDDQTSIIY